MGLIDQVRNRWAEYDLEAILARWESSCSFFTAYLEFAEDAWSEAEVALTNLDYDSWRWYLMDCVSELMYSLALFVTPSESFDTWYLTFLDMGVIGMANLKLDSEAIVKAWADSNIYWHGQTVQAIDEMRRGIWNFPLSAIGEPPFLII